MDIQSHVEITRLHCEHLCMLLDHVISELTTIEQTLATKEKPSSALVESYLTGLEKQSDHIAVEAARLQRFVHSLVPKSPDAVGLSLSCTPSGVTCWVSTWAYFRNI